MEISKQIIFHGRVQGVGFRQTVRGLAQNFPVRGIVRNLSDGTVELLAEGEAAELDSFVEAVSRRMAGYIQRRTMAEFPVQGFRGFNIQH